MLKQIIHVGITVSNLEKSRQFYRDILGLKDLGEIFMEGEETEILFAKKGVKAKVAYLSGENNSPPVELIQFIDAPTTKKEMDIFTTGISELCFYCDDLDKLYARLQQHNVPCFSKPQPFDFTKDGFGKSRAIYFRDPDGVILEVMEYLD